MLEEFIASRQGSRGLTPKGETWLRETLSKFLHWLPVPLAEANAATIIRFLSQYDDKPWRKHSFYRSLKTFWKWSSRTYDIPNPFLDRHGNPAIDAPKTPYRVLYTLTPELVSLLIEAAPALRDKAILSLLADSGCRRAELVSIQTADVDLERRRILVWGKNRMQGCLIFGPNTQRLLARYMGEVSPQGSLFGLNQWGVKSMLDRLGRKTGIHCNSHSFSRGFATELRKQGLSELDIAELGRWSSTAMVKLYSRAYTFENAASRYRAIV